MAASATSGDARCHLGESGLVEPPTATSKCDQMEPPRERIRFYYLDKRVKGECIRLALVVAGLPFEDVRLSYEDVAVMRAAGRLPFSQVPVLQIGEDPTLHGQSQALLRWAGRQGGLYPEEHQLRIDAVTDTVVELYDHVVKVGYGSAMTRDPHNGRPMVALSMAQRMEVARSNGELLFPARFQQLERLVVEPAADAAPKFFCGEQLTIADLSLYVIASAILDGAWEGNGVAPEVLDGCPKLRGIVRLVGDDPRVKAWNEAHPARWFG